MVAAQVKYAFTTVIWGRVFMAGARIFFQQLLPFCHQTWCKISNFTTMFSIAIDSSTDSSYLRKTIANEKHNYKVNKVTDSIINIIF